MSWDDAAEAGAKGGRTSSENQRKFHEGAVAGWRASTPKVLQDAIQAGWNGTATPAQKRLLKNWVTARVMDAPIPMLELLLAQADARRRASSERSSNTRPDSPGTGGGTRSTSADFSS